MRIGRIYTDQFRKDPSDPSRLRSIDVQIMIRGIWARTRTRTRTRTNLNLSINLSPVTDRSSTNCKAVPPSRKRTSLRSALVLYLSHVYANSRHQTLHPPASGGRCCTPTPDRTAQPWLGTQADPALRPGRFWQDHAGLRMGCRSRQTGRLAVAGRSGQRSSHNFLATLSLRYRRMCPIFEKVCWACFTAPQPPPTEAILTALLNRIAALPGSFVLVFDDYHVLDAVPDR